MERKNNERSLKSFIRTGKIVLAALGSWALTFIVGAVLIFILGKDQSWGLPVGIVFAALAFVLIGICLAYGLYHQKQADVYFYEQALEVSKHNMEAFKDHSKQLKFYDNHDLAEFRELNRQYFFGTEKAVKTLRKL